MTVSEGGGRARLSAARARGGGRWAAGERREREGAGPSRPKREGGGGKKTFRDFFLFIKPFQLCLFLFHYYLCSENSTKI